MDGGVVPIVPAAVIFDLPVGGWGCRPTAEFGYAAAQAAEHRGDGRQRGRRGRCPGRGVLKGGIGTASVTLPDIGVTVGALVVVNSAATSSTPPPGCRGWST